MKSTTAPYTLHLGDCLDSIRAMPDNSVDAIVTDPPYGLSFMGKRWDYDVPSVDVWAECLRVLKPGGHLLAFAGTRTQHRMVVRIEDAGFEIRDMIAWVYGSGFPKSLDVSKAIDKRGGNPGLTAQIGAAIKAAREARGLSASECDRVFCGGTTNWSWFEGRSVGQRAPTPETFAKIAQAWPELAPLAEAVAEVEREVVGQSAWTNSAAHFVPGEDHTNRVSLDITAPATEAARQWQGWGTAMKPALEPITFARKPLVGTVAENVLAHGTGAINIDGCRVGTESSRRHTNHTMRGGNFENHTPSERIECGSDAGRWPANLIHDGSEEVLALFPQTKGQQGAVTGSEPSSKTANAYGEFAVRAPSEPRGDTGSAARFFYCAKASRSDRNEGVGGSNKPAVGTGATMSERENADWAARNGNHHPTVKPTDLMRYLCRLVTPPGGLVLDPFMGSGSTGKAAILEGFRFIGCEREPEYLEIARARIAHALASITPPPADPKPQGDLFAA